MGTKQSTSWTVPARRLAEKAARDDGCSTVLVGGDSLDLQGRLSSHHGGGSGLDAAACGHPLCAVLPRVEDCVQSIGPAGYLHRVEQLSPVQPRAWWREAADADLQQLSCFLPVVGGRTGRWCRVLVLQCHVSLDIVTDSLCLVHMSPAC